MPPRTSRLLPGTRLIASFCPQPAGAASHGPRAVCRGLRVMLVGASGQSPGVAMGVGRRRCVRTRQVHGRSEGGADTARSLCLTPPIVHQRSCGVHEQEQLVRSLEAALASPSMPPEIVTCLLNLAEFMEHDEKTLPLDTRTLGALAEKCHAFAKALHYKEIEFMTNPHGTVEALISINNHLRQPEAAVGMLKYAQQHLHLDLKEGWYEKLQRWDDALAAYNQKVSGCGGLNNVRLGPLRSKAALRL